MNTNYNKVEKIAEKGYKIEFGEVFEKAFENFKKIFGIAGVSLLIVSIVLIAVVIGIFGIIYGFTNYASVLAGLSPENMSISTMVGFVIFTTILTGLMSPISAGFLKMAHLADTNQTFGIGNVFEYYSSKHFVELFISSSTIGLISGGISYFLEFSGINGIGNVISGIISLFTFLSIPLIIFSDLKAFEAIKLSWVLVSKNLLIIFGLLFVSILFVMLGIFGLCIGIIFTMPFIYSMHYTIYKNVVPFDDKNELDEIGNY